MLTPTDTDTGLHMSLHIGLDSSDMRAVCMFTLELEMYKIGEDYV